MKTQTSKRKKEIKVPVDWCDPETFVVTIGKRTGSFARRLDQNWQAVLEQHFDGLCLACWRQGFAADFVGESEGILEWEAKQGGEARVVALPCIPTANKDNEE